MKLRRFLSSLLFGVGCAVMFIGLLATVLPMIQNDQLRLVLSSFEMPSENVFVNAVNSVMTYALRNCYLVMLIGAIAIFAGILLMLANRNATRNEEAQAAYHSPYAVAADDAPVDVPVWRASRAPEVAKKNPFADPAISELLAPGRAPQAEKSNPFAAFAPAAKPKTAIPVASVRGVADVETLLDAYKPPARAKSTAQVADSVAAVPAATAATAASSAEVSPVSLTADASPVAAVVPVAQPFVAPAAAASAVAPVVDASAVPQVAASVAAVAPVAAASAVPQVAASVAPVAPATPVALATPVAPITPVTAASAIPQVAAPVAPLSAAPDVVQPMAAATPAAPVAPAIPQPEVPAVAAFPSVQGAAEGEAAPKPGASQSGSRIVIRSTFSAGGVEEAASAQVAAPAVQPQPEAAPRPMQPAAKAPGSRIKSTMGKHS